MKSVKRPCPPPCLHRRLRHVPRCRGALIFDIMVSMGLLVTLMTLLTVTLSHHRRGLLEMEHRRALVRSAEQVLITLRQPGDAPDLPYDHQVRITPLNVTTPDPAWAWASVTVSRDDDLRETLIGMVPANHLEQMIANQETNGERSGEASGATNGGTP